MSSGTSMDPSSSRATLREYGSEVALPYLLQRALLIGAVYFGAELIGARRTWHALPTIPVLDGWLRWDSQYYLMIASDGYGARDWGITTPFFPLYPILIVIFGAVLPYGLAALVVSNAAAMVALCLLYAWVKESEDVAAARRAVRLAILFPTSFFLTAGYSESVYLVTAVGTTLAWTLRKQWSAAAGVVAACLARPVGVIALSVPFAAQWLATSRRMRDVPWFVLATAFGAAMVLLIYYLSTGDPLAFLHSPQVGSLGRLARAANPPPILAVLWDEGWSANLMRRLLNFSAVMLVVAAAAHFARRRRFDLALITITPIAVPLYFQRTLFDAASMARYALTAFPLFLALARWVPDGPRGRLLDGGFQMFQIVLALNFVTARWAE